MAERAASRAPQCPHLPAFCVALTFCAGPTFCIDLSGPALSAGISGSNAPDGGQGLSDLDPMLAGDGQVCAQQGLVILSGIQPPAVDQLVLHLAALDVGIVHVRDLEFSPG